MKKKQKKHHRRAISVRRHKLETSAPPVDGNYPGSTVCRLCGRYYLMLLLLLLLLALIHSSPVVQP